MLLVQPPRLAWALLVPGLALHTTFGVLSGWVSWQLVRAMKATAGADADVLPKLTLDSKTAGSEAK